MDVKSVTCEALRDMLADPRRWSTDDDGPKVSLAGVNLSRMNLAGVDLSRADLSGADLAGANLSRANLSGANLVRADLCGADLCGSNFSKANLLGANLFGVDLYGANLCGADLSEANLIRTDFTRADLSDADLYGADISWADFYKTNITRTAFYGSKYCGMTFAAVVVMVGLYRYQCWAVVTTDGTPFVRMGCLWHSVAEWDAIGIRNSNTTEFPDDGSDISEERAEAFELMRAKALRMAEAHRKLGGL